MIDGAIKRKVRDYVDLARSSESKYKIYVQDKGEALNALYRRAYDDLGLKTTGLRQNRDDVPEAREWMCINFYDVRTFGAVMTTQMNAGRVRGPSNATRMSMRREHCASTNGVRSWHQ